MATHHCSLMTHMSAATLCRCCCLSVLLLLVLCCFLQGFLASDRKSALELFDKAEEFFKQCKGHVSHCSTRTHRRHIAATQQQHSSNTAAAAATTCSLHRLAAAAQCLVTEGPTALAGAASRLSGRHVAGACSSCACDSQKLSVGVWLERLCGTAWCGCVLSVCAAGAKQ